MMMMDMFLADGVGALFTLGKVSTAIYVHIWKLRKPRETDKLSPHIDTVDTSECNHHDVPLMFLA